MGAFDLIRKGAKGIKNAPFFSKADVVLDELQRGKGTGDEFLTELVKKGVKPTELKDRGLDKALKGKPKMTKAEVQKVFEQKAPPKVQERVLREESPDYEEFLEAKAQEEYGVDWFDLSKQEKARLEKMFNELPTTQYEQYKTPGGENYREILLKLPSRGLTNHERWELDLYNRDLKSVGQFPPDSQRQARYEELKAKEGDPNYISGHYKNDPNLLAHIRVQDFKTPEGKKVLLVDELQSDWHQEGRKKGYRTADIESRREELTTMAAPYIERGERVPKEIHDELMSFPNNFAPPDAPFKKNWHELAMKRVLDYAAENGYDSVAITPGAEQAKRYDLSKQLDRVIYSPYDDGTFEVSAMLPDGREFSQVAGKKTIQEIEETFGKEIAQKMARGEKTGEESGVSFLSGEGLQVGGEGMKGFYDKILPDYLNNYGKQYGAQVGSTKLMVEPQKATFPMPPPGQERVQVLIPAEFMDAHSFDITPQMREQIKTKGQPLYSKIGVPGAEATAATGAATMGSQMFDENNEQSVQNPVHFTENPDAMLLELMQRN